MSCRIERLISEQGSVVLRVRGRIEAEHADKLKEMLGQERGRVTGSLEETGIVDPHGLGPVASFERNGIELRNCPAYVREWIIRERADSGKLPDLPEGATDDVEDLLILTPTALVRNIEWKPMPRVVACK